MNEMYQKDQRQVTRKDVANRAGVSAATVSYVINDGPRNVSEDVRQRVLQAIGELGYRPNVHARKLQATAVTHSETVRAFGLIIANTSYMLQSPFYSDVITGIHEEALKQNLRLRFIHFMNDLVDPVLFNELIHEDEISAVLFLGIDEAYLHSHPAHQKVFSQAQERIRNVICVERTVPHMPAVVCDPEQAGYTAVSHLIHLGHKRIVYIGRLDARYKGYQRALFENGLPFDKSLHFPIEFDERFSKSGVEAAGNFLQIEPRPTAVFCFNDETAMGFMHALKSHRIRIPEDIAVVSIDNVDFSQYLDPPLTTVDLPKNDLGAYAIRLMIECAKHPDEPATTTVLPSKLCVRRSCGIA